MRIIVQLLISLLIFSCNEDKGNSESKPRSPSYEIQLSMQRINQAGLDPFTVTVDLKKNGSLTSGESLNINVSKGSHSSIIDNNDGTYSFTVTPSSTGEYPIQVSIGNQSITRTAIVLDTNLSGSGQPMAIPGDYVNTQGYEDGATITPDGEYLFVQYGPIYFSGVINFTSICSSGSYTVGYDINTCDGRTNSSLVFDTIGPYYNYQRPDFPIENISGDKLTHLNGLVFGSVFNGIAAFPTVFYGFKRQQDGTFAEPFKFSFNDSKGVNGPFGPSFVLNGDGTAKFLVAWDNYFDGNADGGTTTGEDDKPDIYHGTLTLGNNTNLGDVSFSSTGAFSSITPNISPVGFSSHANTQGNPHAHTDSNGDIVSIWVDDEQTTHDLYVYRLTSGSFPSGSWTKDTLPSDISSGAEESQPYFTGTKLYLRRGNQIAYHDYTPTNGSCASTYTHNDCWGVENVVIGANANSGTGQVFTVGEPTIASYNNKTYLYFVYTLVRENSAASIADLDVNVGFVELD